MSTDALHTRLRLVHPPSPGVALVPNDDDAPSARTRRAAERRVASANREASTLTSEQMRDAFASRVVESLEGGRSAILRPEARERLLDLGARMGIRRFDAHLVIALTQDAARRGEVGTRQHQGTSEASDLSEDHVGKNAEWFIPALSLSVAIAMGLGLAMLAIVWFLRG